MRIFNDILIIYIFVVTIPVICISFLQVFEQKIKDNFKSVDDDLVFYLAFGFSIIIRFFSYGLIPELSFGDREFFLLGIILLYFWFGLYQYFFKENERGRFRFNRTK